MNETIDRIYEIGATVITAKDAPIHASGHGWQEELKLMLNLTKPRYVMPVHGDHKRLRLHSELAEAVGVDPANIFRGRNGLPLEIDANGASFGEDIHAGTMYVDGVNIGEPDDAALRDRREISADGIFIVVATISTDDGSVVADPEVIFRGVAFLEEADALVEELKRPGRRPARGRRRGRQPRVAPDRGRPARRDRQVRLPAAEAAADDPAGGDRGLGRVRSRGAGGVGCPSGRIQSRVPYGDAAPDVGAGA